MAPAELAAEAIADPAIGAEKLVMGSDSGTTSSFYVHDRQVPPSFKKKHFPEIPGHNMLEDRRPEFYGLLVEGTHARSRR